MNQLITGVGNVKVMTTVGRGASVPEVADRALNKIISVGESMPPAIRDQAIAYKEEIRQVLEYYMAEAIRAEHTNIKNRLARVGQTEILPIILED